MQPTAMAVLLGIPAVIIQTSAAIVKIPAAVTLIVVRVVVAQRAAVARPVELVRRSAEFGGE